MVGRAGAVRGHDHEMSLCAVDDSAGSALGDAERHQC